ncbi:hypothetical protein [Azoarcus sp. DN11]|uniref:hypothetical protein n=1 Tax=Azoarcus sp. DN11 TaxID=356837 RepID=UPI000EAD210E|nr:hypothetical protein [Azoarcus sp. DN11]AYH43950.1 hypothetical protein CDA09_11210 [Azoarcus sp. DN11]
MSTQIEPLIEALAVHGLIVRGGLNFGRDENVPPGPSGHAARAVVLVGQAGASAWPHFCAWRERQASDLRHPLDTWAREVIGGVAAQFGARAVSPSDRPFVPFQQWAMRAEGLRPSPLGLLMHPRYGLWHAYRGALLFDTEIDIAATSGEGVHPCDACVDKPCLTSCPIGAYSGTGFDYAGCRSHLHSGAGERCMSAGCLDRRACPHGAAYRYPPDMQVFHMKAFTA